MESEANPSADNSDSVAPFRWNELPPEIKRTIVEEYLEQASHDSQCASSFLIRFGHSFSKLTAISYSFGHELCRAPLQQMASRLKNLRKLNEKKREDEWIYSDAHVDYSDAHVDYVNRGYKLGRAFQHAQGAVETLERQSVRTFQD